MKSRKLLGVILFISGIILSMLTNLYTGDEEIVSIYNNYKVEFLYLGILLVFVSIIITVSLESPDNEDSTVNSISGARYFGRILKETLTYLAIGLFIGLIVYWILSLFSLSNIKILAVTSVIAGAVAGIRFDYLNFGEITGFILGGLLGYATTYYFSSGFSIEYIPEWLNKEPIIVATLIAGIIGLFTAPYKIKSEIAERESLKKRKEKIEKFELAVMRLKSKGLRVRAKGPAGQISPFISSQRLEEDQLDEVDQIIAKDSGLVGHLVREMAIVPKPPYVILDGASNELYRFTSFEAFLKFSNSL